MLAGSVLIPAFVVVSARLAAWAADPAALFDASYYASVNPDVAAAAGSNVSALYLHYVTYGMAEGRETCPWFDLKQYKQNNPDLVQIFGNDNLAYYQHYLEHGMAEEREGGGFFDAAAYAAAYPDVAEAVGNDAAALYQHFITAGIKEGRLKGLTFNADCYAALNPDVASRCGTDTAALYLHYVTEGAAQGREGAYADIAYKWYCDQKGEHTIKEWVVETYTTCSDPGVQRGICVICGTDETHIDPADSISHVDKNMNDRCDFCGARLNTYLRK